MKNQLNFFTHAAMLLLLAAGLFFTFCGGGSHVATLKPSQQITSDIGEHMAPNTNNLPVCNAVTKDADEYASWISETLKHLNAADIGGQGAPRTGPTKPNPKIQIGGNGSALPKSSGPLGFASIPDDLGNSSTSADCGSILMKTPKDIQDIGENYNQLANPQGLKSTSALYGSQNSRAILSYSADALTEIGGCERPKTGLPSCVDESDKPNKDNAIRNLE